MRIIVLIILLCTSAWATVITMGEQIQIACNYNQTCVSQSPTPLPDIMVFLESLNTSTWIAYDANDPSTLLPCPANMYIDSTDTQVCDDYLGKLIKRQCRGMYAQACMNGGLSMPPCCK